MSSSAIIGKLTSHGTDCSECMTNGIKIIKLKRLNAITIGLCILFGVGGISFSTILLIKYLKLKSSISRLETRLSFLNEQLNILSDSDLDEQSPIDDNDDDDDKDSISEDDEKQNTRKFLHTHDTKRHVKQQRQHNSHVSRCDEITRDQEELVTKSILSNRCKSPIESEFYETPSSSPTRQLDNESTVALKKKSISFSNNLAMETSRQMQDDNKSLEAILKESHEGRKKICSKRELNYEQDPTDLMACLDFIKALYILSESETAANIKKDLRFKAYELAKTLASDYPESYLAKKWYAITIGSVIEYLNINDKIKFGIEFKIHLDEALKVNNTDYLLYYLRGRWSYKMTNLSWAEKYGIRLMYGQVPNITLDDAFQDFLKADELNGNQSKGNQLYLAKCYIEKNQIEKALFYLRNSEKLPIKTAEILFMILIVDA